MSRSADLTAVLIAILNLGAVFVPLDTQWPTGRILSIVADAKPGLILADDPAALSGHGVAAISVADLVPGDERTPEATPGLWEPSEADQIYLLHTSGSTGEPKAVSMTYGRLGALLEWQLSDSGLGSEPLTTLNSTSIGFDVFFQETLGTILSGGKLVVVSEFDRLNPAALWATILAERVERIFMPDSSLQILADFAPRGVQLPLKQIITAGEQPQMSPRLREMCARCPGLVFQNHYGPAETHVVTAASLTGNPYTWPDQPPIGSPVAGAEARLIRDGVEVNQDLSPGEIWIELPTVGLGYPRDEDLTRSRFGVALLDGRRLEGYLTGDWGQWKNGVLVYLGRRDDQVKIAGVRVDLEDVRAQLAKHEAVDEAVVLSVEGPSAKRIVAFARLDKGTSPSEVLSYLRSKLPVAYVPSQFLALDRLPINASGKVDRVALVRRAEDAWNAVKALGADLRPETDDERAVAEAWFATLGHYPASMDADFFAEGGTSLLAMKILGLLSDACGSQVPTSVVFLGRTPRLMAAALLSVHDEIETSLPAIADTTNATARERALWFTCEASEASSKAYNVPLVIYYRDPFDSARLCSAMQVVVDRFEALKRSFVLAGGDLQRRSEPVLFKFTEETSGFATVEEAVAAATALAERAIALDVAPLYRTGLYSGDGWQIVCVVFHHIICDGQSLAVFERALADALLDGDGDGGGLRQTASSQHLARPRYRSLSEQLNLDGFPTILLPINRRERDDSLVFKGGRVSVSLSSAEIELIRGRATSLATTVYAVLLGSAAEVISNMCESRRILVASPFAEALLVDEIGYLTDTLVIPIDVRNSDDPVVYHRYLQEQVAAAIDRRGGSMSALARGAAAFSTREPRPIVQYAVAYQGALHDYPSLRRVGAKVVPIHNGSSKFDMTFELEEHDSGAALSVEYDLSVFGSREAEGALNEVLNGLVSVRGLRNAARSSSETLPSVAERLIGHPERYARRLTSENPRYSQVVKLMQSVFSAVLGVDKVGEEADFFALGGDSMTAIRLIAAARHHGVALQVKDLYLASTVAGLSKLATIDSAEKRNEPRGAVDENRSVPASIMQVGLLHDAASTDGLYVDSATLTFEGDLTAARAEEVMRTLSARHPALTSRFEIQISGEIRQVYETGAELPVHVLDARSLGATSADLLAETWKARIAEQLTFDARLLAAAVVVLRHRCWRLDLVWHHAILDGLSVNYVLGDLVGLLDERVLVTPSDSFGAQEAYQRAESDALSDSGDREYWAEYLDRRGRESSLVPASPSSRHRLRRNVYLHPERLRRFRSAAEVFCVQLKTLFLSCHLLAIARISANQRLRSVAVANCRPESQEAIAASGMFLNLLPYFLPSGLLRWRDVVGAVEETERSHAAHRRYPYQRMLSDSGQPVDPCLFNYVQFMPLSSAADSSLRSAVLDDWSGFALSCEVEVDQSAECARLIVTADPQRVSVALLDEYLVQLDAGMVSLLEGKSIPADPCG